MYLVWKDTCTERERERESPQNTRIATKLFHSGCHATLHTLCWLWGHGSSDSQNIGSTVGDAFGFKEHGKCLKFDLSSCFSPLYTTLFVETHLPDSHRLSALLGAGDETQFFEDDFGRSKLSWIPVTVLHHFSYSLAADGQESSKLFTNFDPTCTV